MKVERPQGPRGTGPTHKAGKAAAPGFAGMLGSMQAPPPAHAPHTVTDVGALIAVQAAGEDEANARDGAKRGRKVLSALTALQASLLFGAPDTHALADAIAVPRPPGTGPELSATLDAIDLRAAVEVAKARRQAPSPPDRRSR